MPRDYRETAVKDNAPKGETVSFPVFFYSLPPVDSRAYPPKYHKEYREHGISRILSSYPGIRLATHAVPAAVLAFRLFYSRSGIRHTSLRVIPRYSISEGSSMRISAHVLSIQRAGTDNQNIEYRWTWRVMRRNDQQFETKGSRHLGS